jgi:integrating conjugative element membrane protein (TIGR03745 family)
MNRITQLLTHLRARRESLQSRVRSATLAVLASLVASPVLAALPTAVTTTSASGDYIALAQEFFKKGFLFLGLLLASYGLYTVAGGAVAKFNEFRIGRAELSDVVIYAVVGVVILIILVYLLTEASTIL